MSHEEYMQKAFELSKKGTPSPNPYVGCVIVKDNIIIGQGYHKKSGEAHAEINAIKDAKEKGNSVENSTLYVTLEPCSHFGKTPPCCDILIKEKIAHIVIGMNDPNPIIDGSGIEKLKQNHIIVTTDILTKKITKQNEFYIKYITTKKPFVLLKAAMSLDGKITYGDRKNKKITGKEAHRYVHELRNEYDAILVGINTILLDNPRLDCRIKNGKNPIKIILDNNLKTPTNANIISNNPEKTIIVTLQNNDENKIKLLKSKKVNIIELSEIKIETVLKKLGNLEITSLLVEGGSKVYKSFLENGLVDKVSLFYSPKIIGGDNSFFIGKEIQKKIHSTNVETFGKDILISGYLQ